MARTRINPLVVALGIIAVIALLMSPLGRGLSLFSSGASGGNSPSGAAGHITHIVLFQWKSSADPDAIVAAHQRMMALQTQCRHPRLEQPYIVSLKGGRDHSAEGLQHGATHGYVVEFASMEDRDYYVKSDPAHNTFKNSIADIVEKATVLDFTNGFY